ncbi:uncharacterized protein LOC133301714 [Gastrolobium bilobum]|uniref:uncharacterized protein LOC133301714 n=1 Tax=Gastrolobium bilobum TaxID=150636 RepID=UPI002AB13D6B|nr:uncharacterized protein LOC133301714 [Gastrolobium bilobum]
MQRPPFQQQQQYQQTRQQSDNSSSLENMLKDFMARNDATVQSQSASIKNLENQIKATSLRNGKAVYEPYHIKDYHKMKESEGQNAGEKVVVEEDIGEQQVDNQTKSPEQNAAAKKQQSQPADKASRPPPPFPQRLHKQQDDKQFKRFMDVLKQLHINVPLALCDLGASINLMPKSIFTKLGIREARPTTVTLQLADRSITYPEGKIENVLVRVDKFIFPADFNVLDFEADREVPLLLGRPFLATGRTFIDVEKGALTMRVNNEQITFNVLNALKYLSQKEECAAIEDADEQLL